jgi:hypothetical protein
VQTRLSVARNERGCSGFGSGNCYPSTSSTKVTQSGCWVRWKQGRERNEAMKTRRERTAACGPALDQLHSIQCHPISSLAFCRASARSPHWLRKRKLRRFAQWFSFEDYRDIPWAVGKSLYCYALRISMVLGTDSQERSFGSAPVLLFIRGVRRELGPKGNTACFPSVHSLIALLAQLRGSSSYSSE